MSFTFDCRVDPPPQLIIGKIHVHVTAANVCMTVGKISIRRGQAAACTAVRAHVPAYYRMYSIIKVYT